MTQQTWRVHCGDALTVLKTLPDQCVDCVVTSPPYWGLRNYGHDGQIGVEATPQEFVSAIRDVFREARRVLSDDGVAFCNLGDCYAAGGHGGGGSFMSMRGGDGSAESGAWAHRKDGKGWRSAPAGMKSKDLVGIPWAVAFALRDDGWYLRADIIWSKPNPMPESCRDRVTKSHEYVFMLSKSHRYYYNQDAIREPYSPSTLRDFGAAYESDGRKDYAGAGVQNPSAIKKRIKDKQRGHTRRHAGFNGRWDAMLRDEQRVQAALLGGANARSVWTIATEPSPYEHFAVMPRALARKCILAGCPPGGAVFDPFAGVATTGVVALEEGRSFIGIELNPKYHAIARERLANTAPLLAQEVGA